MNRDKLISQVKEHYQNLASDESQQEFTDVAANITPSAYYEKVLGMVIDEIGTGKFDSFRSGQEIADAVANDKDRWLPGWNHINLS